MNAIARVMRANSRLSTKLSVNELTFMSMARILRTGARGRDPLLAQRREQGFEPRVAQAHVAIRQRHHRELRGRHDPDAAAALAAQVPDFELRASQALDLQAE